LRIRRFTKPVPGRTIALAWRRGSAMRDALQSVSETIREAVARR
jgi:DNA-binding transcriptional LysR family regulator